MHPTRFIQRKSHSVLRLRSRTGTFPWIVPVLASIGLLLASGTGAAAAELFSSRSLAPDAIWSATRGARAVSGGGLANAMGNPAALSGLRRSGVAVSHLAWAGDLSRDWVAVGSPLGSRVHFGLDASLLRGSALQGYDALGQKTETFSAAEWNLSPQLALDLGSGIAVGTGIRYFRLEDPFAPVDGFGLSAGLRWAGDSRSFGASLTDWGGTQSTPAGDFDLPSRWRLGLEQSLSSVASIAVSTLGTTSDTRILASASYSPVPALSLLGGVESGRGIEGTRIGWSTGFSADRGGIVMSYAFSDSPALGAIHQFGIEVPFRRDRSTWDTPRRR